MDPLACLREFCISDRLHDIKQNDARGVLSFGDEYEFPQDVPTALCSAGAAGEGYPLDVLLFFLRQKKQAGADKSQKEWSQDYMRNAMTAGVKRVHVPDHLNVWLYLTGQVAHVPQLDQDKAFQPPAKRPRADAGDPQGASKRVQPDGHTSHEHERQLRGRHNLLLIAHKDFSQVVDIFKRADKEFQKTMSQLKKDTHAKAASRAQAPAHPAAKSSSRMDRGPVAAPKQYRQLGVDIYGDNRGPPVAAPAAGGGALRQARPSAEQVRGKPPAKTAPSKLRPIIVVPEGASAMINLTNAKRLLEKGHFMTTAEARVDAAGEAKAVQQPVLVRRPSSQDPSKSVVFELVDKTPSAKSERWDRVVAVICQGKKWQFKEYPFQGAGKGDMVETFSALCGFYFHFVDEGVPDTVKQWNVKLLPLARSSRHNDLTTVSQFFEQLRKFLDNKAKTNDVKRVGCKPEKLLYK